MRNFVVHSNESACRKSGCLGLEQVLIGHINSGQPILFEKRASDLYIKCITSMQGERYAIRRRYQLLSSIFIKKIKYLHIYVNISVSYWGYQGYN